ncbi:MAG TPA: hypothetical protein VFL93_12085 [Longimicrobiaceae bacterium]|nr:hypothetical protein [Longimicrobiaceae bacterium]
MLRTTRFLASYLRYPTGPVQEEEVEVPSAEGAIPATLYRRRTPGSLPGWVALHGITVPGRRHAGLQRFAHALAGAGTAVLVPEIRPWADLRVDSGAADRAIRASAAYLAHRADVQEGGVGVVGFSFGATQALITAAEPEMGVTIRQVVGFGGYCDLRRAVRFMFTGEHEWDGVRYHLDPDPYGRWIAAANYLTRLPGYTGMDAVARAARKLAEAAGLSGDYAGDSVFDPLKRELRRTLRSDEQRVWDLIATPAGMRPAPGARRELAEHLAEAALAGDPGLDPRPVLRRMYTPTVLAHGIADHLLPFTGTLRLRDYFPPDAPVSVTLTRLFAHSGGAPPIHPWQYPRELARYLRLVGRAFGG